MLRKDTRILLNGGQRRLKENVGRRVVIAHHRDIARDALPHLVQALEQTEGDVIRTCEHSGGISCEHRLRGLVGTRNVVLALKLQTCVDRQANLAQRALIAGKSFATRIGAACVNQASNTAVALLDQIAGGHVAAHLVVEHHLVALESLNGTVDHYGRDGQVADFFAQGAVVGELVAHDQEDAINAARHQLAQQLQIVIGASARAGNEERIAVLAAALFQATGERGKKAALDVRDDKAQGARLAHDQAARDLVGNIVVARRDLFDELAVFFRDATGPIIEHKRDRRGGKPHLLGDLLEGDFVGHLAPSGFTRNLLKV